MTILLADLLTAVKVDLDVSGTTDWSDAELTACANRALHEISKKEGCYSRGIYPVTEYTRNIDITNLSTYNKIIKVEHPPCDFPPNYRKHTQFNATNLEMQISTIPTITDGTLTGTLTFTQNSTSVTGVGTAFTTELDEDYFICKAAGTRWYRVLSVTDDTNLILDEAFGETTATDTEDSTKYRDNSSCAYVWYDKDWTVTTTTDMPGKFDDALKMGTIAYAAKQWVGGMFQARTQAAITKIASAVAEVTTTAARITQAVTDIGTARTNKGTDVTAFGTAIGSMDARITQAIADLVSGRALVNTLNIGGADAPRGYVEHAKGELSAAEEYLNKALGYIKMIADGEKLSIGEALAELQAANAYLQRANTYNSAVIQEINSGELLKAYRVWAKELMTEYKEELNTFGRISDDTVENYSED